MCVNSGRIHFLWLDIIWWISPLNKFYKRSCCKLKSIIIFNTVCSCQDITLSDYRTRTMTSSKRICEFCNCYYIKFFSSIFLIQIVSSSRTSYSYSYKPGKIKRCCFIVSVIYSTFEFFWKACLPSSWGHRSWWSTHVRVGHRWTNWSWTVPTKTFTAIFWHFRFEFIGILDYTFIVSIWFSRVVIHLRIDGSVNLYFRRCCCLCSRRCCSHCGTDYLCRFLNFTFKVTILPSYIWITGITPWFSITIWIWALVMHSIDWSVLWIMRPIEIPSLTI